MREELDDTGCRASVELSCPPQKRINLDHFQTLVGHIDRLNGVLFRGAGDTFKASFVVSHAEQEAEIASARSYAESAISLAGLEAVFSLGKITSFCSNEVIDDSQEAIILPFRARV